MKVWQRNALFVAVTAVVALVMYFAGKFFGFIGGNNPSADE